MEGLDLKSFLLGISLITDTLLDIVNSSDECDCENCECDCNEEESIYEDPEGFIKAIGLKPEKVQKIINILNEKEN